MQQLRIPTKTWVSPVWSGPSLPSNRILRYCRNLPEISQKTMQEKNQFSEKLDETVFYFPVRPDCGERLKFCIFFFTVNQSVYQGDMIHHCVILYDYRKSLTVYCRRVEREVTKCCSANRTAQCGMETQPWKKCLSWCAVHDDEDSQTSRVQWLLQQGFCSGCT